MTQGQADNAEDLTTDTDAKLPSVQVIADLTIGYAAIQNNVPVIREILVTNDGETTLSDVELVVKCVPAFAEGTRFRFEALAPGESRRLAPVDLRPDHQYFSQLDESERAVITASMRVQQTELVTATHNIDVLAYDQWAGTRSLPELLAAFCMPNSRVVDKLLARASGLLRQTSVDLSMDGYQSKNRERVWKQASAIYSTIVAEDIQYSNPPASFGNDGQKIRTPERILDGKLATCLDLAMLFASCLEQAGLHPVVLFKEGHAWVGVWLIETSFPTALVDDVQAVRKRVKSGEFVVFETTGVAGGQKPSLRWACTRGEEHLNDEAEFAYAVDIRRAREVQIRPLPSRSSQVDEQTVSIATAETPIIEDVPQLPPLDPVVIPLRDEVAPETPEGRLAKWKSKLLDLTLRNKLLNFKPTKSTLRVICPDPGALEDRLADGKEFRVRAKPKMMSGSDSRDATVYAGRNGTAAMDDLATDALGRNEIVTDIEEEALEGRLLDIFRAASTGMEEGGANTLFLAFGMLEWQESKAAESSHLAPILLIPVTLSRQSVRSGFRLARHDDDALVNPTLLQKLQQDFSLKLPSFDVLPTDDRGIDVNRILQTFRLHVGELKGWEVKEQVHLGIFSFTKYLMWKDLRDRQKQLQESSVVAHLINNPGKAFADCTTGFEPSTLDEKFRPQDLFTPLLSDSSQLRAVCVAAEGKNLVIEGPPGTGKSQTISNLIAHLLATGKTVLFVSEKVAALEVYARAQSVVEPVAPTARLPEYELTSLDNGNPDYFYEGGSMSTLASQLLQVIETEGPVSQAVVFKRVTRAWGLSRVGSRIEAHLSALVPRQVVRTTDNSVTFYWPEHANPSTWEGIRLPGGEPETRRGIDEISLEELGNAALYILTQQGGTSQDGLAKAVCRLLGVARTTVEAGTRISRSLTHERVQAVVAIEDGSVRLRK